jgi:hypothetical protein
MVVQLQSNCTTGNFMLTTSAGTSNGILFTVVNSGRIHYVSAKIGKSTNVGTFQAPWGDNGKPCAGLTKAKQTMMDGDITYLQDGYNCNSDDGEGWGSVYSLRPQWCGSGKDNANPRALLAYPGANVTMGNSSANGPLAVRLVTGCLGFYTFAEINMQGGDSAASFISTYPNDPVVSKIRLVGNTVTAPNASIRAQTGTLNGGNVNGYEDLGNHIHDGATNNNPSQVTALYHGWYFGGSHNVEVGWDLIDHINGCRGMQIYSGDSQSDYNYLIHDNVIHDTQCDGIGIYPNAKPSLGYFKIYNNIIYNAGKGPYVDGGDWACIYWTGSTDGGTMEIYNNTLFNCGSISNPPYASIGGIIGMARGDALSLNDNIVYQTVPGAGYVYDQSPKKNKISGKNNLFYGIGSCSACLGFVSSNFAGTVKSNPSFVNVTLADFHLTPGSLAKGAAANPLATYDHDGLIRPSPSSIGAYEYAVEPAGRLSSEASCDDRLAESMLTQPDLLGSLWRIFSSLFYDVAPVHSRNKMGN